MIVTTIYDLEMPKIVHVQFLGIQEPAHVTADKVQVPEKRTGKLILKLGDEKVAEFENSAVVGWWIQDTDRKDRK
jgi:hypothetical protein